jgi:CubicO group peptidase (beta-lactamase class C family)
MPADKRTQFTLIKVWLASLLSILLLTFGCGRGQSPAAQSRSGGEVDPVDLLVYEYLKGFPEGTQASLAIIENSDVRFLGVVRQGDSLQWVDNRGKAFEIGSISKVFTSTLLANFVLEGKVNLDDDIGDYIDTPIKDDARITFQSLANHTSGLPRSPSNLFLMASPDNPYKNYDDSKLETYLSEHLKFSANVGAKSEYSNLGAGLLGYTLEKVSGSAYQELLAQYIVSKYQMKNSTTRREEVADRLVGGLNGRGEPTSNWDLASLVGAGGILSTVEDLSKFALAQFDDGNRELALTRKKTFAVNERTDIGLGWHINNTDSGDQWHWHNGGTGGYRSCMAIDVKHKNGMIILSNVSAFHNESAKIDQLCFALMGVLNN